MKIIDGKKLSQEILSKIKREVAKLHFRPVFCDVLVGNDPASVQYVKMKAKTAESVGIRFHNANFLASITTEDLIKEIKVLNNISNMCGIIVQLPLPESLDKQAILDAIDPLLDVDCLGTVASANFYRGETAGIGFPTALACMTVLDSLHLNLASKNIIVLGQGTLVGKPVTALLKLRGLNHIIIRSKTSACNAYGEAVTGGENKEKIIKQADVIISGIGKGKYITGDMIKKGTILIDAGTSESLGPSPTGEHGADPPSGLGRVNIVGDVDLESVKNIADYVSPVPGGVGPVTVAMLLQNVLMVAKKFK